GPEAEKTPEARSASGVFGLAADLVAATFRGVRLAYGALVGVGVAAAVVGVAVAAAVVGVAVAAAVVGGAVTTTGVCVLVGVPGVAVAVEVPRTCRVSVTQLDRTPSLPRARARSVTSPEIVGVICQTLAHSVRPSQSNCWRVRAGSTVASLSLLLVPATP